MPYNSQIIWQFTQRSHHNTVQQLEADIRSWIKDWNTHPKRFLWTKTADEILESLGRLLK